MKTLKFINWPMRTKAMCIITICQLALSGLLLSGVIHRTDNSFKTQVKTVGQEINSLLSVSLTDPLLHRDYSLLQQIAEELVEKKTVSAVRVLSPTGAQLAQSGTTTELNGLSQSDNPHDLAWDDTKLIRWSSEIHFGGQYLGKIYYSNSLEHHVEERKALVTEFLFIALVSTALAIGAAYLLSGRLVRRIDAINRVSDAALQGDYKRRAKIDSNDELGQLAGGLNRLADSVTNRMAALIDLEAQKTSYLHSAQTERARLTSLLDSMRLGIVFLNNKQELVYSNDAVKKIWPEGLPSFVHRATNHGRERTLKNGQIIFETSHIVTANSAMQDETLAAEQSEDRSIGSLWIFEDVTAERQSENTIRFLAERDSLTSLYNRRSFTLALQNAIEQADGQPVALVYIDIDDLKLINDLQGHPQGDKVLISTANKLSAASRATDVVARIGGDEFVVLASGIPFEDQTAWCDRLVMQLSIKRGALALAAAWA
jgi:diguanylate cyclase (GGDEF)-like protein